ncbi:hypothetical protein ACVRWB_00055 [Streptococcus troglodytae]|uniref:Uncharacterized protein n=1 Tax=Streptococcus troglodytae TaxID=1111760 RepID=A0A1L7LJI2_9STRE|nr:hypothetical protein [Streptococcus troglodytae]BAQ24278.1 putative uncharacterized protein [Streptococcus troglodytae]
MGIFTRFFNKSQEVIEKINETEKKKAANSFQSEWEPISAFIPADEVDYQTVSLIATAIAAEDHPNSQFAVKKILQRNPESLRVSLIAASIAAGESTDCQLTVKRIYQKK